MNLNVRLEDLDQAALLKTTRRLLAEADALSSRLAADKKVMGTINFALKEANAYTTDDTRIGYMLSLQLSAAIRNAHTIEELRRAQDELNLSVEELDAYGHTIAHDLKSPLSSILFKRDLLLMRHRDELSPKILAHLEAIGDNGQQMTRMIDQLLWLAKIRHTDEAIEAIDVRATVDAAIARFDHNLSDLGVEIFVDEDLPPALGHPQWLEEVFANLISNAIKYRGDNNLSAQIHIHGHYHGDRVRYEVCDNGIGIKEDDIQKLFTMFSRLHTTQADGLGLGLSIIHRIINKLGGELGVNSTFGAGTSFWFKFDPALAVEYAAV